MIFIQYQDYFLQTWGLWTCWGFLSPLKNTLLVKITLNRHLLVLVSTLMESQALMLQETVLISLLTQVLICSTFLLMAYMKHFTETTAFTPLKVFTPLSWVHITYVAFLWFSTSAYTKMEEIQNKSKFNLHILCLFLPRICFLVFHSFSLFSF